MLLNLNREQWSCLPLGGRVQVIRNPLAYGVTPQGDNRYHCADSRDSKKLERRQGSGILRSRSK